MEREHKLSKDLHMKDALMSGFTFEDLVITLQSNEPDINAGIVRKVANEMVAAALYDFNYLMEINMGEIIDRALGAKKS